MSKSVKRVVKNSFFQTFGAFGNTGFNFLLTLGYARFLGPEVYGSLVTSQAQVLVCTILVELGLSHSLIGALTSAEGGRTELSRQGFRARDLLFRVLFVRFVGALIGTSIIYAHASSHAAGNSQIFWQDMAFAPHLFALALQQTAVGLAMYRHRQGLMVMSNLLGVVVTVAMALFLAWRGAAVGWLLLAQCWGGLLSGGIIFGYFFVLSIRRKKSGDTRRLAKSKGGWGREAWTALLSDAWPYAITYGTFVLWQRLDQLATTKFLGLEAGGQYALAVRLVGVPIAVATAISFAIFPDLQRVGRDAPEKMRVLLGFASKAILRYGVLFVAIILGVIGVLIVPIVPKFKPAVHLLPFFIPGVWAYWMQSFLVNALFGLRKYKLVVAAHLYSLVIFLVSLLVLTPWLGLYGVVASFNIFCLSMCFFCFRAARSCKLFGRDFKLYGAFSPPERELWMRARLPVRSGP